MVQISVKDHALKGAKQNYIPNIFCSQRFSLVMLFYQTLENSEALDLALNYPFPFFPPSIQIKFQEGIIGTPQLTDSIVVPENVEFLGQKIDLTPFKGLINSVQDTASSVAKTISSQPPLKFSLSNSNAESWLLTTYLDEELRISRGDGGSVYVLIKEGSSLLTT
jgi:hypothetical protein